MDEKELRTSVGQRIIIVTIALILLVSTVATYLFIVMSSKGNNSSNPTDLAEVEELYTAKVTEATERVAELSDKYADVILPFYSRVKAYNKNTANSEGLKTTDLKEGQGKMLTEGDNDYYAYYIGWCADGTVFDATVDDTEKPTKLTAPLEDSSGNIAGWREGVVGMRLGGVREITMTGALAYGDTREICGGTNSPLKFIVMAVEPDEKMAKLYEEINQLYLQYNSLTSGSTTAY